MTLPTRPFPNKIRLKLLIVAPFRGGTTYAAAIFRKAGLRIKHEDMGLDGTVSGHFVTLGTPAGDVSIHRDYAMNIHTLGEWPNMYSFDHVWQQTRDPLKTIGSIRDTINGRMKDWARDVYGIPFNQRTRGELDWAVKLYYHMSLDAERLTPNRYKIEQFPWEMFKGLLGLSGDMPNVSTTTNRGQRTQMAFKPAKEIYDSITYPTWDDIESVAGSYYPLVREMATRYGY